MIINGIQYASSIPSISYEFGFSLRNVNKQTFAIDYGISTDHIHSSFSIDGNTSDIFNLHSFLSSKIGEQIAISDAQNLFGPCYTSATFTPVLSALEAPQTIQKGLASLTFKLSDKPSTMASKSSQSLDLSRFAVASIAREFNESVNVQIKMVGYNGINHGWTRPEIDMAIKGTAEAIGSVLAWLASNRTTPFQMACNASARLINSMSENIMITGFSNLAPIANSGWWSMQIHGVKI